MNKHIFRLVFSKHLGMYVPASEMARTKSHKSLGRRQRIRRRLLS
ncbi:MAG: ESPR domain-containing protein, partial [Burkholderiaceae bacterium]|nr:ESPR domain-containing protein [Burkholderiaceae bacterium]